MKNNKLKLTKEGGHHKNRIAYVGDYTGKEIENILVKRVKKNANITIFEDSFALKLIVYKKRCYGAQILRKKKNAKKSQIPPIENIFAQSTILATGGLGQIFKYTTNPQISTGDGIALAASVGCKIKDLEFIQFHPTALDKKLSPLFLMSETLRGEGAKLLNSKGEKFMEKIHPLKDLAPRDIIAREIYKQLKKGPVYLDITHKKDNFLKNRFPQIYRKLKSIGIDMNKDLIPVTPAAHYICGGIVTDLHGRTNIKNLFAFGEVTCTGVHGANRLASNSLLEALVFSNQIIKNLAKNNPKKITFKIPKPRFISLKSPQTKTANKLKKKIKELMWQYAGIIRNCEKIKKEGIPKLKIIENELNKLSGTNQKIQEARNMTNVSLLILEAAHKRKKSLGCHFVQ